MRNGGLEKLAIASKTDRK